MTEGRVCSPLDCCSVCSIFYPSAHPLIFQTRFKVLLLFSKACANSGDGIIHMATGMHLGVTLPRAVHHPPSCICVPKSFLSMQLEREIDCQLGAASSCPFLLLPSLFVVLALHFILKSLFSYNTILHIFQSFALLSSPCISYISLVEFVRFFLFLL